MITIEGKSQPDLYTSFKNGSLCKDYLRNFAALVSVESPTDTVIRSERVIRLSFFDKLSQVGGILALCAGLSVMSSFELVFFVINLVMIFFKMICRICGILKNKIQDYDMERELTDDELQMFFIRSHVSLTFHIYLSHSKYLNLSTFYFFFQRKNLEIIRFYKKLLDCPRENWNSLIHDFEIMVEGKSATIETKQSSIKLVSRIHLTSFCKFFAVYTIGIRPNRHTLLIYFFRLLKNV